MLAVRHTLLHRCTTVTAHQLEPGRLLRLILDGPTLALNLVSVHLDTSLPQMVQHTLLRRLLHLRDPTLDFITLLSGDFNFTFPGDSRLRLCDTRHISSDDPLGAWFVEQSDPFKAIHYDGYSRVGHHLQPDGSRTPAVLSAIDHVMTDLPPAELLDLRPLCAIRCNPLTFPHSDHVPVILLVRPLEQVEEKAQTWPPWLYWTKEYADAMKQLASCTLTRTPSFYEAKQFLTDTLDDIFLRASSRPATSTPEHLYWATRALRLSRLGANKGIRRCLDASPPFATTSTGTTRSPPSTSTSANSPCRTRRTPSFLQPPRTPNCMCENSCDMSAYGAAAAGPAFGTSPSVPLPPHNLFKVTMLQMFFASTGEPSSATLLPAQMPPELSFDMYRMPRLPAIFRLRRKMSRTFFVPSATMPRARMASATGYGATPVRASTPPSPATSWTLLRAPRCCTWTGLATLASCPSSCRTTTPWSPRTCAPSP